MDTKPRRRSKKGRPLTKAETLRLLVEQVNDYAIFMLDASGRVTTWNAGAKRLKGFEADQIIGQSFSRFFTEEARAAGRPEQLLALARAEGRVEDEGWRIRKDGSRFWANVVISPVYDESGALHGFAKVTRDVTERRRLAFLGEASAILLSSLDYEQTLARVAELCVPFLADWASVHLSVERGLKAVAVHHSDPAKLSVAAEVHRRFPPGEDSGIYKVIQTGISQLVPEISEATLAESVRDPEHRRMIRELGPRSALTVPLTARGTTFGVISLASAESGRRFNSADLEFARSLADRCAQAIDNARAHAQVRVEREFLRGVVAHMREGVVVREAPSGKLLLANEQARRILREAGSDDDGLTSRTFFDEAGQPIPPKQTPLQRALREGEISSDVELSFDHGSERVALSFSAAPATDPDGRILGVVATFRDITARKQREKELEEEAAAREMFFGIVGHDLRSPLGAIVTASGLLLRRGISGEDARVVERIVASAGRMKSMISDLLDLTRARLAGGIPIHPRPANLEDICRAVLGEVSLAHPECTLRLETEGDLSATVDPDRVSQVVANLVSNAVQFGCEREITATLRSTGDGVELKVHNFGEPIPSELLRLVFDPFRRAVVKRTSKRGTGLGLGLFIVREIVESHGGSVEVTSDSKEGTSFRVWLPRHPAQMPGPRSRKLRPGSGSFTLRSTQRSDSSDVSLLH